MPSTPYYKSVVEFSKHVALFRRFSFEIYGTKEISSSKSPSIEPAIVKIVNLFERAKVFDKECATLKEWLWAAVNQQKDGKIVGGGSKKDVEQEKIPFLSHEDFLRSMFGYDDFPI